MPKTILLYTLLAFALAACGGDDTADEDALRVDLVWSQETSDIDAANTEAALEVAEDGEDTNEVDLDVTMTDELESELSEETLVEAMLVEAVDPTDETIESVDLNETVEFDDELAKRYGPDYLTPSTQSVDDVVRTKQVTDSDTKTKTTKRGRRKT